jgi:hypothetical protein
MPPVYEVGQERANQSGQAGGALRKRFYPLTCTLEKVRITRLEVG